MDNPIIGDMLGKKHAKDLLGVTYAMVRYLLGKDRLTGVYTSTGEWTSVIYDEKFIAEKAKRDDPTYKKRGCVTGTKRYGVK